MPDHKLAWEEINTDYGISKIAFGMQIKFVRDKYVRQIIFRDIAEAHILAKKGFNKPAVILAGSVIEELLRLYLQANSVKSKGKTFTQYITACQNNGLLKNPVQNLSHAVREFRNLVHLSEESGKKHAISRATAKGAVASLFTIANDFAE